MVKVVLDNDFEFNLETTDQDGSTDYITSCIKDFGNWEPNVTRKFVRILESAQKNHHPGLVLDIGSCFGYYSIIFCRKYKMFCLTSHIAQLAYVDKFVVVQRKSLQFI